MGNSGLPRDYSEFLTCKCWFGPPSVSAYSLLSVVVKLHLPSALPSSLRRHPTGLVLPAHSFRSAF